MCARTGKNFQHSLAFGHCHRRAQSRLATATGGHRASVSVSSELGQKATSFAGAINRGAAKICLDTGREGAWIHMHVDGFVAKELPGQCWEVRWSVGGKTFYTVHALSFWNCEDNFDNIDEQDEVYVLPAAPTTCAGLRVHINHLTFSLPFRCSVLCLALVPVSVVNPIVKGVLCTRTFILTLTTNGSLKYLTGDQETTLFVMGCSSLRVSMSPLVLPSSLAMPKHLLPTKVTMPFGS